MRAFKILTVSLLISFASGLIVITAFAAPSVPGFTITVYVNLADPYRLSFSPAGFLYVGNSDNDPSGAKIREVGPGGSPLTDYGPSLYDPDAVLFDSAGVICGFPGSVLVSRLASPSSVNGEITVIKPDQTAFTLFTIIPTGSFSNPDDMTFDNDGRLLVADPGPGVNSVLVSDGGSLSTLFTLPEGAQPSGIAVDNSNRIFTGASDGIIRIHTPTGLLIDGSFATGMKPQALTFGKGGVFGTDLYGIDDSGNLIRIDNQGSVAKIGSGFEGVFDLSFGPDGALYASDFSNNRILRIAPATINVDLDIKPGSFPNSLYPDKEGVIPVAILTSSSFDATDISTTTVRFGATGVEAESFHSAPEDIDEDGDIDLVFHFKTQATGIQCGDTSAYLTGETLDGNPVQGSDSISTVGCK